MPRLPPVTTRTLSVIAVRSIGRRGAGIDAAEAPFLAEYPLHLATEAHRLAPVVGHDIAPADDVALLHRPLQRDVMRQADRQGAMGERICRRHQPSVNGEAALAVELLPGGKVALGGRHRIATKARGAARRLVSHTDTGHRDAEPEPDQMIGFVHRGVAPPLAGDQPGFGEASTAI